MSIFAACMLFVVLILVYIVIAEVFTVVFRLTGMTAEKARFQVISLLTNSGFTTKESEIITASRVRRRLARATMMFGYVFTVSIVSAVVNIVLAFKLSDLENMAWTLAWPVGLLLVIAVLGTSKRIKAAVDDGIGRIAQRVMFRRNKNHVVLIDNFGEKVMAEVHLAEVPELLKGVMLRDTGLKEKHDILVMLVRQNGASLRDVSADTVFNEGDTLVALGEYRTICEVFGAAASDDAVE